MDTVISNDALRGRATYYSNFTASSYFEQLKSGLTWRQNTIRIFGKTHAEPRLTAWYGPAYTYSSIHWPSQEIPAVVEPLRVLLMKYTGFEFNAVLANYYRDGHDGMGWHRDNEREMDTSLIASLSFGDSRVFKLREVQSKKTHSLLLEDKSLLLMADMQADWEHAVMKTRRAVGPRINLTFRRIHLRT